MTTPEQLLVELEAGEDRAHKAVPEIEHATITNPELRSRLGERLFQYAETYPDKRAWSAIRRGGSLVSRPQMLGYARKFLSPKMDIKIRQVTLQVLQNKGPFETSDPILVQILNDILTAGGLKNPDTASLWINAVAAAVTLGMQDVTRHLKLLKEFPALKQVLLATLSRMSDWHKNPKERALINTVRNTLSPPTI